jgi:hypothetical protein
MFRVVLRGEVQEFERWTDALEAGKALIPQCKSLLQDIRIFYGDQLIWIYSRSNTYPQFIGAGMYNRLARLFIEEAIAEQSAAEQSAAEPSAAEPSKLDAAENIPNYNNDPSEP